jgi:nicotinamidase-related amidase
MIIRHPLSLLTRETQPLILRKDNTCLLLLDLHSPFTDIENGWLSKRIREKVLDREFDEYFHLLNLVTPNIGNVLEAFREQGIPVVYSSIGYYLEEGPSVFQKAIGWTWDLGSSLGSFPPQWEPLQGDAIFSKPGWSALANSAFRQHLDKTNISSVVIMGTMFDFGIQQTCIDLGDRGIGSLIVTDGVAALTQMGQDYTGNSVAHGLIKLRSAAEILGLLEVLKNNGSVLV